MNAGDGEIVSREVGEEEEEEEEEGLFKADAVNEEDPERDRGGEGHGRMRGQEERRRHSRRS